MSVKRPCKISSDCFCHVCGYYTSPEQKKLKVIPETKFFIAYETYFGMKMGDQDKSWAPHFCCESCRSTLEEWMPEVENVCHLPFPKSGESLPIIMMTAISAWWTFFVFLFYLPYLSSIHEKANCIAILWTGSPHSLGSCLFRDFYGPPVFHIKVGHPVKCLAQGHNKRTCRLVLHSLPEMPSAKQGSCGCHFLKSFGMTRQGK